jgi:hypothetical protein
MEEVIVHMTQYIDKKLRLNLYNYDNHQSKRWTLRARLVVCKEMLPS